MTDQPLNPRLENYCRVSGMSPEQLEARDGKLWLFEFTQWNRSRLVEYSKVNPSAFTCGGLTDHEAYDAWLNEYPAD